MENHTAFIQLLYSFYIIFIQFSYNFCTTFIQLLYNFCTTFLLSLIPQKVLKNLQIQCFRQIHPDGIKGNIPVFLKLKLMPYIPPFILKLIMWSYLRLLKSVPFSGTYVLLNLFHEINLLKKFLNELIVTCFSIIINNIIFGKGFLPGPSIKLMCSICIKKATLKFKEETLSSLNYPFNSLII